MRVYQPLVAPLLLLVTWLPGCNQGGWRSDTPFYVALSRLMLERGTLEAWWFPMAGTYPYFNKPPLPFWIHAVFYRLIGTELWAARLPTLVGAMLAVEAARRAFGELGGRRVGLFAAVVLALTHEFFRYTRAFSLDIWVVLFLMLSAWGAAAAVRRDRPVLMAWGGIGIGLCLLCKPLFALLFPVIYGAWLAWIGRPRWAWWCAAMALVGVALAVPWHVSMTVRWGSAFIDEYFGRQSLARAVGEGAEAQAWWYLPVEFGTSYWPWLLALIPAVWLAVRGRPVSHDRRLDTLALLWVMVFVAGLAVFSGKKIRYAVPVYPALAALAGSWLACRSPHRAQRIGTRWLYMVPGPAVVLSGVLALTPIRWSEPGSGEFERLDAVLQSLGDPRVWCVPDATRSCAVMYLRGGAWPGAVATGPGLPGGYPDAGDVVLYPFVPREGSPVPRAGDEVLGKFSGLTAVRLRTAWRDGSDRD